MAQVVSNQTYTLESSTQLTRPHFRTFLQPDTNVGQTNATEYKEKTHIDQLNVPNVTGAPSYAVDCCEHKKPGHNLTLSAKKKGDNKIVDPITGFISTAGEVLLNTGKFGMPSFGKARVEPHTTIPQHVHSVRVNPEAIDELKRTQEGDSTPDLKWNSRKVIDIALRSRLGGWTSEENELTKNLSKNPNPYRLKDIFPNMKICYTDEADRDEKANRYRFTSSTQEMYNQVNWDSKLPKKLHAPVTTYEAGKADALKRIEQANNHPQIWQTSAGATWDRLQDRKSYFRREDVAYTAPTRLGNQIPGYSGHIHRVNTDQMDDVIEKFETLTVLRTQQPKEPAANFKPNIPGYTGRTHHFKTNSVSHYDKDGRPFTTTAAYHREIPMLHRDRTEIPNLNGDFARIQTKVAPQNPYDQIKRDANPEINHSLDNVSRPTVISKKTNHEDYLIKKKEVKFAD